MEAPSLSSAIAQLLPQIGQAPPAQVSPEVRRLADQGDAQAILLTAWSLGQTNWEEGIPYAEKALDLGAPYIAGNYIGNMIGNPAYRERALRMLEKAIPMGYAVDPLSWVQQMAQQGDQTGLARLLELAMRHPFPGQREEWERLLTDLSGARDRFQTDLTEVEAAKQSSVEKIAGHERAVQEEVERLRRLGQKVETLAHDAAATELSEQYETEANRNGRSAFWLTVATVLVGALAAGLAGAFTLEQAAKSNPDPLEGLAKAGIALPIALFATYLGRLAGNYRHISWRWRHVALQLRTAEPYIAEIGDQRREQVVEALALRFFPGQPLTPEGMESGETVGAQRPTGLDISVNAPGTQRAGTRPFPAPDQTDGDSA